MSVGAFQAGIRAGVLNQSFVMLLTLANGTEATGKVAADMSASYYRQGGSPTPISVVDLTSLTDAYTPGGVKEVDPTAFPGLYRFDPPNALAAIGADFVVLYIKVTGCFNYPFLLPLTTNAPQSADSAAYLANNVGANGVQLTAIGDARMAHLNADMTSRQPSGPVTVAGYSAGQDPAAQVLVIPGQKLATDGLGRVGVNNFPVEFLSSAEQSELVTTINDLNALLARSDTAGNVATIAGVVNTINTLLAAVAADYQQRGVAVTLPATAATQAKQDTIIGKTNLIPAAPATEGNVTAVGNAVATGNGVLATLQGILNRFVAMIENVGGERFTSHAVSQAPTGGGASDPLVSPVPGAYPVGSAGAALGRLQEQVPGTDPVIVLAEPVDATKCRLVGHTRSPNTPINFALEPSGRAFKAGRILGREDVNKTVVTDDSGDFDVELDRNDLIQPAGTQWHARGNGINFDERFTLTVPAKDLGDFIT